MILPADNISVSSWGGPAFDVGELVEHKRYGYRGLVVARDLKCKAPDEWYESNKTKPHRDQPWYHVLIDGTISVTYAAQSSLRADPSRAEITHPLLSAFFDDFHEGRYARNERPWPGWKDH